MNNYAVYSTSTGVIERIAQVNPTTTVDAAMQATIQCEAGEAYKAVSESCKDDTHYIDLATLQETEKAVSPVTVDKTAFNADGQDLVTFSNIPVGAEVLIDLVSQGVIAVEDGGVFEYSSDLIGVHSIFIRHIHYLDYEIELNAS